MIKNVVVALDTEYLEEAAKVRGISRTRLVKVVMEKIIADDLVPIILNDGDRKMSVPKPVKYRRFASGNKS
ncbi:hypothetical protein AB8B21_05650 [Tardiphaga sp. 866_E4_N2_1]|uniref:hypothetical protein n=1 Tax=unclassified Tardiphaga TaxID=2631404 RepID=UPI003F1F1697